MTARRRMAALARAEARLGMAGCQACARRRGRLVVVREGRDQEPALLPCPACGQVPGTVILEVVAHTREEARAALASMREATG